MLGKFNVFAKTNFCSFELFGMIYIFNSAKNIMYKWEKKEKESKG